MQHVKMLSGVVDVARRAADRWYVTIGHSAVGPVNLDLLARGVEAGKVPLEAFVRHEGWKVWRPLTELAVIVPDDGAGEASDHESSDEITEPGRPSAPADWAPQDVADVADGTVARRDALMLLLTAVVARGGADAAIVHEIDEEGAVAVCAHGPWRWEALGLRTPWFDPSVVAASAGATVVAEPVPTPASASIVARLSRLAGPIEGALLIPLCAHGRLVGMIEVGRRAPFRSAEIASFEALVAALAPKLEGASA
jgi:hypothetical protein